MQPTDELGLKLIKPRHPDDLAATLPLGAEVLDQDRNFIRALENFTRYLKYEKFRSDHTIKSYTSDLSSFFGFVLRQGARDLDELDISLIRSWLASNHKSSVSHSSTSRRSSSLRTFFAWAEEEGLVEENPTIILSSPKKTHYLPSVLSAQQIQELITTVKSQLKKNPQDIRTLRIFAVIELLYSSGIRISELCSLDLDSINREERTLRVIGKGDKERVVPFGKPAMNALNLWVTRGRPQWFNHESAQEETALFIGPRGKRANPRQIRESLNKVLQQLENTEVSGAHLFRHTAATHMVDGGADIRAVQELLGHSSLATTQIYTHVSVDRLAQSYEKAHPRA